MSSPRLLIPILVFAVLVAFAAAVAWTVGGPAPGAPVQPALGGDAIAMSRPAGLLIRY